MRKKSCDIPWRQGHVLTKEAVDKIGLPTGDSRDDIFVVVSHDCDIVQDPEIEPYIELQIGRRVDTSSGNYTHVKNPRKLHLPYSVSNSETVVEMVAVDKVRVRKDSLEAFEPDRNFSLPSDKLATLQRWLAARYRRTALPDAFNERLDSKGVKERLSGILESLGEDILGVYFQLDDGELIERKEAEDTYTLAIYLLYSTGGNFEKAKKNSEEASKKIIKMFKKRLLDDEGRWQFIELVHCAPISDQEMSIAESVLLKRLDLDYVSLRDPSRGESVE